MSHRLIQRPCSDDESFEQVDIVPTNLPPPNVDLNSYVPVSPRTSPLTREQFESMLDKDGRLVSEHQLRKAVFLGGVQPCIRKEVWRFLFGLYPCTSTAREREALLLDYVVKYNELKSRWKTLLVLASPPGQTALEQGLLARYQLPAPPEKAEVRSPDAWQQQEPVMERAMDHLNSQAAAVQAGSIDFAGLGHADLAAQCSTPEMQQRVECLQLQARVYVNRKRIDINQLRSYLRIIDKDVPRTDRDVEYYKGHANPHLTQLRDILATFACYNDQLGYAQGMNDILARFLYVLGSEVETFWCFQRYMDTVQMDFMEEGMLRKIELVRHLMTETDSGLLKRLEEQELGNLFFCHRWMLLGFKREFSFMDSLRCFEILSSHHLELHSITAERALMMEEMKEFANTRGDVRSTNLAYAKEYTFEVFMCAAILMECRDELAKCTDTGMIFSFINSLTFDLDDTLSKAEKLFFTYCKKTVSESFQLVDTDDLTKRSGSPFSSLLSKAS
ncbi:TBC1 domain family member 15-like [Babylonia areolata]|uniref:TBC1 domain family member 15-like n=1 Tax=Babylonia areolata TaxID=304850 RepID=UPI003FD6A9F0